MSKEVLCQIQDLGLIDYSQAWQRQKENVCLVINGGIDTLLLCEHPVVVTLGRVANKQNCLIPPEELESRRIKVIPVDRGGDVTLHAPGQLVSYPIFNLFKLGKDLRAFLDKLEQVAIDLLQDFDIVAARISGQTGVWVGKEKIASIGIGVRKWVSFHGMAINVNTDLKCFSLIKPCGLDVHMTSIRKILGKDIDLDFIKSRIVEKYMRNFYLAPINPQD
mgnify:CR=1 FL=1